MHQDRRKGTLPFYRALVVVIDNSGTAAAVSYLLGNNVNIYSITLQRLSTNPNIASF